MKFTKQFMTKIENTPIVSKVYNGSFRIAKIEFRHNKVGYSLEVSRSHPLLEQYSGVRNEVKWAVWNSLYTGVIQELPPELSHVKQKLYEAAEISNEEAAHLATQMDACVKEFIREFYGNV